jgi:CRP/FNR family transcriptional regulator
MINPSSRKPLNCKAGAVLFHPGQECPGFVRVTKGTIKVSLTGASGRKVVLYRVNPGDLCLQTFACLTDGRHYSAEGQAETDLEGELISHAEFHRMMLDDDAFRQSVLKAVAARFTEFENLVEDLALTGFDARLAKVLLRLSGDGTLIRATHENLAVETASGRAFVSRRLAEFETQGLIIRKRGALEVTDRPGLERIAADTE